MKAVLTGVFPDRLVQDRADMLSTAVLIDTEIIDIEGFYICADRVSLYLRDACHAPFLVTGNET